MVTLRHCERTIEELRITENNYELRSTKRIGYARSGFTLIAFKFSMLLSEFFNSQFPLPFPLKDKWSLLFFTIMEYL